MLPFIAFALNGLLVGVMVAFSTDQLSRIVIPLLFAAFGGSIVTFGRNLSKELRNEAYLGLSALSLFCLIGLVAGVLTVQHRWLSPTAPADGKVQRIDQTAVPPQAGGYTRSEAVDEANRIDIQRRQGDISDKDAADQLLELLRKKRK